VSRYSAKIDFVSRASPYLLVTSRWRQPRKKTICRCIYSCFEKGHPTKQCATMPKGIIGNGGSWSLIETLGVSAT